MISLTSEVRTVYHRWPAGPKLFGLCFFTIATFNLEQSLSALLVTLAVAAAYLVGGLRFTRQGLRLMRPVFWVAAIILTYHLATRDLEAGVVVCLRLIAAVGLANLVTMTTALEELLAVVEKCLGALGLPRHIRRRIALSVALVVRFIPVLTQKGAALTEAWRARSHKRFSWKLLLPFALLALDDAEQVAEALKARGGVE